MRDVSNRALLDSLRASLVSVVAHEMRTPLSELRLQTDLLKSGRALTAEEVRGITGSTDRLSGLISDWLDWSRIENGTLCVNPRLMMPDRVLRQAVSAVRARFPSLRVTLSAPDGLRPLFADPEKLGQVFVNLLTNSSRYCDAPAPEVAVTVREEGDDAVLTFADNGIAPDQRERIVDCFYQTQAGNRRRSGGTGLGLAISRGLIEAMHGTVRVVTPAGQTCGSVFEIRLPLQPPAPDAPEGNGTTDCGSPDNAEENNR